MSNIDDFLRRQQEIIDTVGWAVMHVLPTADDPDTTTPFAYTVGLTAHHPELPIAGLPPEIGHGLLPAPRSPATAATGSTCSRWW
jgi:hypothetical protein